MADAVTVRVIQNDAAFYKVHLTNISDGTGESNVVKADKSTLTGPGAGEPTRLDIAEARWAMQGMNSVRISWDHTTDDMGLVLSGSGYDLFDAINTNGAALTGLQDPASSGGTGDVLLTTQGATANGTYDITLTFRKVA